MKLTFKQFTNHKLHGNKLEFAKTGSVTDVFQYYEENEWYPSADGKSAKDGNGILIWEEGDTRIENGNCYYYFERKLSELSQEEEEAIPEAELKYIQLQHG